MSQSTEPSKTVIEQVGGITTHCRPIHDGVDGRDEDRVVDYQRPALRTQLCANSSKLATLAPAAKVMAALKRLAAVASK